MVYIVNNNQVVQGEIILFAADEELKRKEAV
jgi:hypothetical protein